MNFLYKDFKFYVLTSGFEFGDNQPLESIQTDEWVDWEEKANVFYAFKKRISYTFLRKIYNKIEPDIIYVNGLFSYSFNILTLFSAISHQKSNVKTKVIISPRGMLHPGALSQKRIKKLLYLLFFKIFNVPSQLHWHATDENEANFIRRKFKNVSITIAHNFPKIYYPLPSPLKVKGEIIMGTIALISPMKNHLEILKVLTSIRSKVTWHIYGPVKDLIYWNLCLKLISELPDYIRVLYHGPIPPNQVENTLRDFQLFIMPSKSENFGHAIFEALSCSKPVITTSTTPFAFLQKHKAGYTINIDQLSKELKDSINFFADMNQDEFDDYREGARSYMDSNYDLNRTKNAYFDLFNI
jgi:glycosyltransferase involved in cell wall biosynthesis